METPIIGSPSTPIDQDILGEDCPVRRILRLVGDKWKPIVVYCLSAGVWRFNDLNRFIPDISKKMLTQVLRDLEADGLVKRSVFPVSPPRTEYCLTETGRRLHEPLALLCGWASTNTALLDEIEAAGKSSRK